MNGLAVKDVNFNGAMLRAVQDMNNVIWVGVRWVCKGIGFSEDRADYERKKIQKDIVLNNGVKFYPIGNDRANSDVLCLMLDYLPLWLAKISITPKMQKESPELVEKLVEYQLSAKDVLAEAFLGKKNEVSIPQNNLQTIQLQMPSYDDKFAELNQKMDKLYSDMGKFVQVMLEKSEQKVIPEKMITNSILSNSKIWKQKIYGMISRVLDSDGGFSDDNEVMKHIYDYMRRNYGVVWEQEVREYMERSGCIRKPSTIDIVYDNETYRSIFESVLFDLDKNSVRSETKIAITTDDIIQPLIEKYRDMSNAGMHTYMMVYRHMDRNNKICWENRIARYRNKYGMKNVSKKNVINTNDALMKMFKKSVSELLKEGKLK